MSTAVSGRTVEQRKRVVIRFAGDSGDGMQLTGDRFTAEAAAFGNDLATPCDESGQSIAALAAARLLPASTVTAAFHHLSAPSHADRDEDHSGEVILVCGDDAAARARVIALTEAVPRAGVLLAHVDVTRAPV
jgi:2-oxoglutarate/2-oxoacid ferredoxin oxidoreductase subunit alpha